MRRLAQLLLLGALILLPVKGVRAGPPEDPIYVKTSNGWNAAYAHGNKYAEFRVIGNGAKLQEAYHILLQKGVGMMVSLSIRRSFKTTGICWALTLNGKSITGINVPAKLKVTPAKI
jgi:hypothetical protein